MTKALKNQLISVKKNRLTYRDKKNSNPLEGSSKNSNTLKHLFENGLRDVYNAEKQLIKAIPEMANAAFNNELKSTFYSHLEQTKKQAVQLEKILNQLHTKKSKGGKCDAMEELINEGNEIITKNEESSLRDSALIISAQKIEHYEIATYGSLCELAEVLGYFSIAEELALILEEEEFMDKSLTDIAQEVNDMAYELSKEAELV